MIVYIYVFNHIFNPLTVNHTGCITVRVIIHVYDFKVNKKYEKLLPFGVWHCLQFMIWIQSTSMQRTAKLDLKNINFNI